MTTSASSTESTTTQTPAATTSTGYVAPADTTTPAPEEKKPVVESLPEGNSVHDMYSHVEKKPEEKIEEKPVVEETPEEKVVDPATGYEKDEEKVEVKAEDNPGQAADDAPPEEFTKEELVKTLGELGEGYDIEGISKLAIDNKFTKEQIKAYVDFAKTKDSQSVADQEQAKSQQRNSWKQELKDDKDFSGENGEGFLKSVKQVDRVLDELMPNTRENLTKHGRMLPPYVMRDILNISRTLNPKSKLVNGEASIPVTKDKGNFLDEMYK